MVIMNMTLRLFCFFLRHPFLQLFYFVYFSRFAHVSHHSHHSGPVLCHWQLCDAEAPLDARVHSHLHTVLCQVLHHRCDCVGGGRARRAAAGCHHLPGIFCQGEQCCMLHTVWYYCTYGIVCVTSINNVISFTHKMLVKSRKYLVHCLLL